MPGSSTTPGRPSACAGALGHIAFHYTDSVGTRNQFSIAAQWLACTFPCRRFADILTDACARLGADVVRYSFIAVDLHHLLLAGLPAHLCKNSTRYNRTRNFGLYGHAESKKTQKFVFCSALRPNQISFSHNQDPSATLTCCSVTLVTTSHKQPKDHRPFGSSLLTKEHQMLD
jgi:hypothetical protein